jgi:Domain of unknown function (DUF4209)
MFERLDRTYGEAEIAQAAQIALGLEADDSLEASAKAFGAKASELDASEPRCAELLAADAVACELQLGGEDSEAKWGGPLGPKVTFEGGEAYPPYLRDWPDSVRPYFEARARDTALIELRARYNDLLWARWKRFPSAQVAHQAYLTLGTNRGFGDARSTARTILELSRAVTLSQTLRIDREATAAIVVDQVSPALAQDKFHAADLITETSARLLAVDPAHAATLIPVLMAAGHRLESGRAYWARGMYHAAATLAGHVGTDADVAKARAAIATSWENEAAAAEPTARMAPLRGAIAAYQAMPGTGEPVQRLKAELAKAVSASAEALPMHKFEFRIPAEETAANVEKIRRALQKDRFGLLRLPAFFGMLPDWDRLKTDFEGLRKQFPLQYLFARVSIDFDGRMQAQPGDEDEREKALVLGHFVQTQQINSMIGLGYLQELRVSGEWSDQALIEILQSLDPELAVGCASGIRAFESGDFWTAVHVLVPQVERAFRKVAIAIEGDVHRLVGTEEVRVASLDGILEDPKLDEVLGANATKSLRGLLTDPRGLNIRNLTAHGLLDPSRDHAQAAYIALMCLLMAMWFRAEILARQEAATANDAGEDSAAEAS